VAVDLGTHAAGAADRLRHLAAEVQALPVLDDRSDEELVGYDEHGLPR
jgi:hypothetical protein